jgi:AraC-like DNA-binding protein
MNLLDYSVAGFGGLFCVVWAIGLALKGPSRADPAAVAFVGLSGIRLLWEAFFLSGLALHHPAYYGAFLPIMYAIGPVLFAYYERLAGRPLEKSGLIHMVPMILAALPLLLWLSTDSELQKAWMAQLSMGERSRGAWWLTAWVIGPKISILLYSLWIPFRLSGEGAEAARKLPGKIRAFGLTLLLYVWAMIVLDISGYLYGYPLAFRMSVWSHSIAAVLIYWFSRLQPSALLQVSHAIKEARYARSKLDGVNVNNILVRLDELMRKESYFADEDLRLAGLAEAVGLSSHQLSELLNTHYQQSFSGFVNHHRIEEACRLLREEEQRSILSIAMAVGFNSKSAFHRIFRQLKGQSPGDYRNRSQNQTRQMGWY